jgi:hypothetical protein
MILLFFNLTSFCLFGSVKRMYCVISTFIMTKEQMLAEEAERESGSPPVSPQAPWCLEKF